MSLIICTVFEDHYHLGLLALTNSLYHQGYRGVIYAGYRGELPKWSDKAENTKDCCWPGLKILNVAEGLKVYFMPLETENELTNYKPDFMLRLINNPDIDASGIFYFDPDIVLCAPWSFYEDWINSGIALCEDVNSPLPINHPRRTAWRQYFSKNGIELSFKDSMYVNGGFVGVSRKEYGFIEKWKEIQELMGHQIGGLTKSIFSKIPLADDVSGPFAPFSKTDQDALNAAIEAWDGCYSLVGQEGMAFKPGAPQMSHALGSPKPWQMKHILYALGGRSPRRVDRDYWDVVDGPVKYFRKPFIIYQKVTMQIAIFICRFYKRS
ncbi:MAG: hypothetical protein ABJB11_15655 [Ferruginibacter sp.]